MALRRSLLGEQLSVIVRARTLTFRLSDPLSVCFTSTVVASRCRRASSWVAFTRSISSPSKKIDRAMSALELSEVDASTIISCGASGASCALCSAPPPARAISTSTSWRLDTIDETMPCTLVSSSFDTNAVNMEIFAFTSNSALSGRPTTAFSIVTEVSPVRLNIGRKFVATPVLSW